MFYTQDQQFLASCKSNRLLTLPSTISEAFKVDGVIQSFLSDLPPLLHLEVLETSLIHVVLQYSTRTVPSGGSMGKTEACQLPGW